MKILAAFLLGACALAQERINADAAKVEDFEKRVGDYLDLEKNLMKGLPSDRPTDDPQAINDYQRDLAGRLRKARAHAHQGEIFTPPIAKEFRRLIGLAMQGRNDRDVLQSLARSEPVHITLHVNEAYPTNIPLQSTPATILMNLPQLPAGLEYRIAGHVLVLRDANANLVIDLIPNAVP